MALEQVTVTILGKDYKLAVRAEEKENLLAAVRMVDERTQAIKSTGKVTATERIAIMAAIQMAGDNLLAKPASATGDVTTGDVKRKIAKMNKTLDEALAAQTDLF